MKSKQPHFSPRQKRDRKPYSALDVFSSFSASAQLLAGWEYSGNVFAAQRVSDLVQHHFRWTECLAHSVDEVKWFVVGTGQQVVGSFDDAVNQDRAFTSTPQLQVDATKCMIVDTEKKPNFSEQ